nr:putative protein [Melanopsichium pennsylvanicum 4]
MFGRRPSVLAASASSEPSSSKTSPTSGQPPQPKSQLPQLDLEASQKLNLARPASKRVIQQCMDMLQIGAKSIDALAPEERNALAKRVTRLQLAQNEAQMRLAQLHGLQPPKSLAGSADTGAGESNPSQKQQQPSNTHGAQPGQKQKQSSNPNPGPGARPSLPQLNTAAPMLRRLSQPFALAQAANRVASPLASSNGVLPSQSSPSVHVAQQDRTASGAHTPMNPPPAMRRPSVLGVDAALSPQRGMRPGLHASGPPSASPGDVSPLGEWHGPDENMIANDHGLQNGQRVPPQFQQVQWPVVIPSSTDSRAYTGLAYSGQPSGQSQFQMQPHQGLLGLPTSYAQNGNDSVNGNGLGSTTHGRLQFSLKPSVFGSAEANNGMMQMGMQGIGMGMGMGMGMGQAGGSPINTPLADLEYDLKVLLSNSAQMNGR